MRESVYLSARYSKRVELCGYANELKALGFTIVCRWLESDSRAGCASMTDDERERARAEFALENLNDIRKADICIAFTEADEAEKSKGGRHVEFGAALALGKECIVIGPRENVFHYLGDVAVYESFDAFIEDAFPF